MHKDPPILRCWLSKLCVWQTSVPFWSRWATVARSTLIRRCLSLHLTDAEPGLRSDLGGSLVSLRRARQNLHVSLHSERRSRFLLRYVLYGKAYGWKPYCLLVAIFPQSSYLSKSLFRSWLVLSLWDFHAFTLGGLSARHGFSLWQRYSPASYLLGCSFWRRHQLYHLAVLELPGDAQAFILGWRMIDAWVDFESRGRMARWRPRMGLSAAQDFVSMIELWIYRIE